MFYCGVLDEKFNKLPEIKLPDLPLGKWPLEGGKINDGLKNLHTLAVTVRIGKEFKIEVKGFTPGSKVVVTIASTGYTPTAYTIKIDKNGKGKTKDIKSPKVAGTYSIVAVAPPSTCQ